MADRYINPFTDYGFKRLFGTEANKDLLIDFLNALFQGKEVIKTLTYKATEQLGNAALDRNAIFDVYCENDKGEKFIVELQKAEQQFFKDRALFYSTFPIQEQAQKGKWNFELKAIYLVAILDFEFESKSDEETGQAVPNPEVTKKTPYLHEVQLREKETGDVFYDKLMFVYVEMPKFTKKEEELSTLFEKWIYAFKFLPMLQDRPKILREKIFKKLFKIAEFANLTHEEMVSYEMSLKYYRDLDNTIETAEKKGIKKGMEIGEEKGMERGMEIGVAKGRQEKEEEMVKKLNDTVLALLKIGTLSHEQIAEIYDLSLEQVQKLAQL